MRTGKRKRPFSHYRPMEANVPLSVPLLHPVLPLRAQSKAGCWSRSATGLPLGQRAGLVQGHFWAGGRVFPGGGWAGQEAEGCVWISRPQVGWPQFGPCCVLGSAPAEQVLLLHRRCRSEEPLGAAGTYPGVRAQTPRGGSSLGCALWLAPSQAPSGQTRRLQAHGLDPRLQNHPCGCPGGRVSPFGPRSHPPWPRTSQSCPGEGAAAAWQKDGGLPRGTVRREAP